MYNLINVMHSDLTIDDISSKSTLIQNELLSLFFLIYTFSNPE